MIKFELSLMLIKLKEPTRVINCFPKKIILDFIIISICQYIRKRRNFQGEKIHSCRISSS